MTKNLSMLYFSATGTTQKVVRYIAREMTRNMIGIKLNKEIDITLPTNRKNVMSFSKNEIVIIGLPVYAGRVPNVLVNYMKTLVSNGATAIPVVVYGNRNYDDALIELKDILESCDFRIIAGAAFIGEHSFSRILAKGRPDSNDMKIACEFAQRIIDKISKGSMKTIIRFSGEVPYRKHYIPRNKDGEAVDIRKVTPKTNTRCIDCKICAKNCSMGSINFAKVTDVDGICIKCGACIKNCPTHAKYFDDEHYLWHKEELEITFKDRREPEVFI